eukprot:s170_g14.t1
MFLPGPLPVGVVDWAPPAGDGGGYNQSYESYESYDRGYGGGNRWVRTGNSKGAGGVRMCPEVWECKDNFCLAGKARNPIYILFVLCK